MPKTDYDGPILEIDVLSISFFTRLREIPAVMDFSAMILPSAVGQASKLSVWAMKRALLLKKMGYRH